MSGARDIALRSLGESGKVSATLLLQALRPANGSSISGIPDVSNSYPSPVFHIRKGSNRSDPPLTL